MFRILSKPTDVSSQPPERDVVTFVLSFPIGADLGAALVLLGSSVPGIHVALFEHWHASLHSHGSTCNELWLRFKAKPGSKDSLRNGVRASLQKHCTCLGFEIHKERVETEERAFGKGDTRAGYDQFTPVGKAGMPALWRQIQEMTEQAIQDRKGGVRAQPPQHYYSWARHIYCNCRG